MVGTSSALGIHAYAHYFPMYDIAARGFQRPFCLAFCAPNERMVYERAGSIRGRHTILREANENGACADTFGRVITRMRTCNRHHFRSIVDVCVEQLSRAVNDTANVYYELYYDNNVSHTSTTSDHQLEAECVHISVPFCIL
jgi:hypothetical protein